MNVLIACEESQITCCAFREKGHNAFSCDIKDCSGNHPEWHIKEDVLNIINNGWDLIIAHPPCTYLSCASACRMFSVKGQLDSNRYKKALAARDFFLYIWNCNCEKICIENPRPLKCLNLPPHSIDIQPYLFGDPWQKLTYLWLKNLPPLFPTDIRYDYKPYISCGTSRNKGNKDKAGFSRKGGAAIIRSKSFPGIAAAMAEQWG